MSDTHDLVDRALDGIAPSRVEARDVRRRLARRKMRSRVATAAVAVVVAIVGIGWAVFALSGVGTSRRAAPDGAAALDVTSLTRAWSVNIPDALTPNDVLQDGDHLYLRDNQEVVAFPKD